MFNGQREKEVWGNELSEGRKEEEYNMKRGRSRRRWGEEEEEGKKE